MIKILVIEKHPGSAAGVTAALTENGFSAESVPAGTPAAQLRCISCALVACELAAAADAECSAFLRGCRAPLLWIAEPSELPRTVRSFRMGREDYVVRPACTAELLARVRMLMRCAGIDPGRVLRAGSLFLDADARAAVADGAEIQLTAREFNILFGLLSSPGKVYTRRELMRLYWEEDSTTSPRAVDVYMARLREKFASCRGFRLVTVYGTGYKAVLSEN